ncbi:MAG: Uma2 family endonuclease [Anaerolineaceae bacterium]|nr:Uma2 family endonuclease [Anaerolineaceae bacterium]
MVANAQKKWTVEEYLDFERQSEEKHEYYAGEIFAMSGASRRHNLIVINTGTTLNAQVAQRACEVYPSDMRVKVNKIKYTYPDVTVVCGEPRFEDGKFDTLLNPTIIIEVLSPSTEDYDRGTKFKHYMSITSLKEYVLIAQDEIRLDHYTRQSIGDWHISVSNSVETTVSLPSIDCTLLLSDIYRKVTFEADDTSKDD